MKGFGQANIITFTLANQNFVQGRGLTMAREEQAARQARMDRLQRSKEDESEKLLGAKTRMREARLSVAVHKDGCNNNVPAGPPSQVVRSGTVLPILVEGDVGGVEASTPSSDSDAWAVERAALEEEIRQLRVANTQLLDTTNSSDGASSQATGSSLGSTPVASRQLSRQEKATLEANVAMGVQRVAYTQAEVKMRAKAWGEVARLLKESDQLLDGLLSPSWGLYASLPRIRRVELEAASIENCLQRLQVGGGEFSSINE